MLFFSFDCEAPKCGYKESFYWIYKNHNPKLPNLSQMRSIFPKQISSLIVIIYNYRELQQLCLSYFFMMRLVWRWKLCFVKCFLSSLFSYTWISSTSLLCWLNPHGSSRCQKLVFLWRQLLWSWLRFFGRNSQQTYTWTEGLSIHQKKLILFLVMGSKWCGRSDKQKYCEVWFIMLGSPVTINVSKWSSGRNREFCEK